MRLGIIGYGTIAGITLDALANAEGSALSEVTILAKEPGRARAEAVLAACGPRLTPVRRVVTDLATFTQHTDLAVEAAGHGAVASYTEPILQARVDIVLTSTGALADRGLHARLTEAAARTGATLDIHGGAIGGLDLLAAAKLAGLSSVTYTSRKPPQAWRGTPAEAACQLATLAAATTFYSGDAAAAARDYPQNANVAATIALKGIGFERTRVDLVADPTATRNTHEIRLVSQALDATIVIAGYPAPSNPKTSATTGFSLAATILDRARARARQR